jgi:hypothetical protein
LDQELDEILTRVDKAPPVTARLRAWNRSASTSVRSVWSQVGWIDSAWGWFGVALVIVVFGRLATGDSGLAWQLIQYAGLVAIGLGVLRLIRPTPRSGRKMWRGRQINMRKPGVELGDKYDDWRKRR